MKPPPWSWATYDDGHDYSPSGTHDPNNCRLCMRLFIERLRTAAKSALLSADVAKSFLHQSGTDPEAWLDDVIDLLREVAG